MRNEARGYFLKEYGSWSVLIIAYLIGLGVSHDCSWAAIPLFVALGLLINSKQAFMKWVRRTGDRISLTVFLGQIAVAVAILVGVFRGDIPRLLPLLIFPALYLFMNKLKGEHFVLTEVLGFTLLSLAAVSSKIPADGRSGRTAFPGRGTVFLSRCIQDQSGTAEENEGPCFDGHRRGCCSRCVSSHAHPDHHSSASRRQFSRCGCPLSREAPDHRLDRSGKEPDVPWLVHQLLLIMFGTHKAG